MCLARQLDTRVASRVGGDYDVVFAAASAAAANINKPIDVLLTHKNEVRRGLEAVRHITALPGRAHACPGGCCRVLVRLGGTQRGLERL